MRLAEQNGDAGEGDANQTPASIGEDDEAIAAAIAAEVEEENEREEKKKKRKRSEKDAIEKIKKDKASAAKKSKKPKKKSNKDDDDDDDDDYDEDLARDMYKKSRPMPGQLEHCEICNKRFTVTPYSKAGPDGGLLCTPCGKEMTKEAKAEKKAAAPKPAGRKRRKLESDRLDGVAAGGAKSLQQLCLAKVAQHHEDIEELGELPPSLVERLSTIFSKQRVMKSKTLPLFLRPDLEAVVVHDAAYLEEDDYRQMFAVVPNMEKLVLANACQLKDEAVEYMLERCHHLKHIQLYAANLISTEMWHRIFREVGENLEVVKLKWLDAAFEDATVRDLVTNSPNLNRIKLELCRRLGEGAVAAISNISKLEHLSLQMNKEIATQTLTGLITKRGPGLRTLSLEKFIDADDSVLDEIHNSCRRLGKLRFSENDTATDSGYARLFTEWSNPALNFVDFNSTRDIDNNNPDGPEDAIGLGSSGFKALMAHSGIALKHLDIASCRHIGLPAFMDVFNGAMNYPELEYINVSFCNRVDNSVLAGIFKSCPSLNKIVAFGCFAVQDVIVPRSIVVIGIPKAQDAIEQFGVGIGVDEAIGRMIDVGA